MKKILRTLIILITFTGSVLAQQSQITGTIVDKDGFPLVSAAIQEIGAQNYTTTDFDGNFTLSPKKDLPITLRISAVGFKTQDIQIYEISEDPISIILKSDNLLDEVVVIGYGSQKKGDLTGAVASVPKELIEQQPVSSIDRAIQGAVAGVQVTQTSGQPGGGTSIRIRGGGSIQGGNEPLYVIDGFPISNTTESSGAVSGANVNPLSAINPADIASIDILKDASATAIYGSRGANGVILITTKSGSATKTSITYDGSYGLQSLRKKIDLLNAPEFAKLRNEALFDKNPAGGPNQYLSVAEIEALGTGTDWQDAAFHTAPIQNHQLSFSGGNDKTRYAITGGYFNQDGIIINTDFERISTRVNIDTELSNQFKVGFNLTGNRTEANLAPGSLENVLASTSIVTSLLTMPPTATIFQPDGSFTLRNPFENVITNPIASLEEQTNKSRTYRLLGTVFGEYEVLKNFKVKVSLGADINNSRDESFLPSTLFEGAAANGIAKLGSLESYSWLNENTLNYSWQSGIHSFNILAGFTQQSFSQNIFRAGSQEFVSDDLTFNSLQSGASPLTPFSNSISWSLISYLGRVTYNFDKRFFLTASMRADGSSRFGKNNKWGYFPSVGLSWKVSNEDFFKEFNSIISDLKIRSSFGSTGNQEIGVFQSLSTLSSIRVLLGDQIVTGFTPDRIANDDLSWETTNQFDAGLDIGLFNNKILITMDAYYKKTEDLLLNVQIPWTSGFSTSLQNFGSVENKGFEFGINSSNINTENLKWDTNFNLSLNRNKVLNIGEGDTDFIISGDYIIQEGKPLGSFYGAVTNGVLQPEDVATLGPLTGKTNPQSGDRLYKDLDGSNTFSNAADRKIIGDAQPDFIFGFTNNLTFKNFDLSIFLQGTVGNEIVNKNRQILELFTGQQNAAGSARNRWSANNTSSNIPRATSDPTNVFSDRFVEDGTYLRVKNITFGYNLPDFITRQLNLSAVRVYVSGQNLITLTNYSGFDPDVTSANNTVSQGTDQGVFPTARVITTGIRITF